VRHPTPTPGQQWLLFSKLSVGDCMTFGASGGGFRPIACNEPASDLVVVDVIRGDDVKLRNCGENQEFPISDGEPLIICAAPVP